ncbi:Fe-S oxidoreductase [hydrothermal vent metagenome]|uniref:Fe-S oxidoreductase n=1 Tax=hydrothermal vent metagenome TaxID=652676 RepID=A0A3B1D6Y3_9ZZZZ
MKIALIHPTGSNWLNGEKDVSSVFNRMAPIGLISLAAYLDREGVEVKVYDFFGIPDETGRLLKVDQIIRWKPDLVGFTSTTSSFLDAYRITEYIKKKNRDQKVIFGGVHISSLGAKSIEQFPLIDYAVIGEGELATMAVLEGKNPATIQGLVYRDNGDVKFSGHRTDLVELDTLPFPAYHMLEGFPKEYKLPLFNSPSGKGATIISSRGCPYICSYCDRSVYGRSFRSNSAEYILTHMVELHKKYGINHFNIYDDLFTLKRKRVEEFCELLAKSPYPLSFNCAARIGHVDRDLLRHLKRGGCWMISLGVESGDQELLNLHKTGVDLNEVKEMVDMIHSEGMHVKGLFIMGLPGETERTIRNTQKYIQEAGFDDMNLAKFAPFPGSPSHATIQEYGEYTEDWNTLNCMNFVFLPRAFKSFREMNRIYGEIVQEFYTSPKAKRRFVYFMVRYPHNLMMILKNLRSMLAAKKQLSPETYQN